MALYFNQARQIILDNFDNHSLQIPILDKISVKLQSLDYDKITNLSEVTSLIVQDQAISARVLKMVNSPAFRGANEITTVDSAVSRLGLTKVINLVVLSSHLISHKVLDSKLQSYIPKIWVKSYVTANLSEYLATKYSYNSLKNTAYMAGLFHDIGELYLLKVLDKLTLKHGQFDTKTLEDILDILHCELGGRLIEKLGLPSIYNTAVSKHHSETPDLNDTVLLLVRLADYAYELHLSPDNDFDTSIDEYDTPICINLNDTGTIKDKITQYINEAHVLLH